MGKDTVPSWKEPSTGVCLCLHVYGMCVTQMRGEGSRRERRRRRAGEAPGAGGVRARLGTGRLELLSPRLSRSRSLWTLGAS